MAMDTTELAREQARKAIWSYLSSITPRELSGAEIDHLTSAAMQAVDSIGQFEVSRRLSAQELSSLSAAKTSKKQPISDPRQVQPVANKRVFDSDDRQVDPQ